MVAVGFGVQGLLSNITLPLYIALSAPSAFVRVKTTSYSPTVDVSVVDT